MASVCLRIVTCRPTYNIRTVAAPLDQDLATNRVTMRAAQAADTVAFNALQNTGWASEAVGTQNTDSPEDLSSDPFANPEGATYTSSIGVSGM